MPSKLRAALGINSAVYFLPHVHLPSLVFALRVECLVERTIHVMKHTVSHLLNILDLVLFSIDRHRASVMHLAS